MNNELRTFNKKETKEWPPAVIFYSEVFAMQSLLSWM